MSHRVHWAILPALLILGAVAVLTRFAVVSDRPLAEDEYYFVTSAKNILAFGVPRFADGGYYFRGVAFQYVVAASIAVFGDEPFAYRMPIALCSLGTLVMAYLLGRRFLSQSWSLLMVAFLTVSSWEVEFAGFSRMYVPLQFVAVCFFWSLYRYSFHLTSWHRYIPVAFAILAVLSHELGVFLTVLLFLPLPVWWNRDSRHFISSSGIYLVASVGVVIIGLIGTHDFRDFGVTGLLPEAEYEPTTTTATRLSFGCDILGQRVFINSAILASAVVVGWFICVIMRRRMDWDIEEVVLGALLVFGVCSVFFHHFTPFGLSILAVALRKPKMLVGWPFGFLIAAGAVVTLIWTILFVSLAFANHVVAERDVARWFRVNFLSFPDLYLPVYRAWADAVPVLGTIIFGGILWQLNRLRTLPIRGLVANPVLPIILLVIGFGVRVPLHTGTRYSFLLYPLALCVLLFSVSQAGKCVSRRFGVSAKVNRTVAIALLILAFCVSEDFSLRHLTQLKSNDVAYRMGGFEKYWKHWYPRWDFQRAGEFVDSVVRECDKVVVSFKVNTTGAYLRHEFAIYWPRDHFAFDSISRETGTRELWSRSRLLSSTKEVRRYAEEAETLWLVLLEGDETLKAELATLWPMEWEHAKVYTPGHDRRVEVWKVPIAAHR